MPCPDHNTLLAFIEQRLADDLFRTVQDHIDQCTSCFDLVVTLAQHPAFGRLIAADTTPDEPFVHELWTGERSAAEQPREALVAGTMVDHFKVMRLLDAGGMGEIYLARDVKLGRKVALKVVQSGLLDSPDAIDRFQTEARATAKLNHPNIVTIHAVGEHLGRPYVALEYVRGQTLRERMNERLPSLQQALRFSLAIGEALAETHRHGVYHRDLKPANVLIGTDGRLRVLDFGLAKIVPHETHRAPSVTSDSELSGLDTTTSVAGTPNYMAPEQWRGGTCSGATDVWALGVVL